MSEPRELLAEALDELADERSVQVNIYDAPPAQLAVPALVVRPDSPWRVVGAKGQAFPGTSERYAVVAVVQASGGDPASLVDQLRALALLAEATEEKGPWRWTETTGVVQVSQDGIDYLATTIRLSYLEA